ncbi:MAG: hypothetical protein JJU45_17250 [Acidimicrobiia bacterium]|nr:hypothetical protein [Acidimicrobiia bacterium]
MAAALMAVGCSGNGNGSSATNSLDADGTCPAHDVTWTPLGGDDGNGGAVSLDEVLVVRNADGTFVSMHLADRSLDAVDPERPLEPPDTDDGGTSVVVSVLTVNPTNDPEPIEDGTVVEFVPESGLLTFRVATSHHGDLLRDRIGAEGTVTVDVLGDVVCARIDYRDGRQRLHGVVHAPTRVVEG